MARIARWMPMAALIALALIPRAGQAQVYQPHELTEPPAVKSAQEAQRLILRSYPRALRDNGIGGRVQVRFVVTSSGSVDPASIEVVAASVKALGEAATKAIEDLTFEPGKKDGAPVSSVVVMPITYGVS
ncbi:MAG: energy transducer TonB [Longimicrobiales bacterium]